MDSDLDGAREHFINGLSRIANFWGFPKAMGAIYGAIYLSPNPISLDSLVDQVRVTKGAISTNVRNLERLRMIHKHLKVGDRKNYYTAEEDFWKIAKGILRERENSEFDLALKSVGESIDMVKKSGKKISNTQEGALYIKRMEHMDSFFRNLDNIVATLLAIDGLRVNTLKKLLKNKGNK
jgi:DNA-binding transcriptional regulator GbsR (MarR family)